MELANHTDGAITAYVRYNPQYSNPTSGVFTQRESLKDEFQLLTPTDFSMYEEGDVEHVGWYYLPVQAKKPIWMDPYLNANINVYMISYVVPLYAEDGTSIGIVGMDIDFGRITDQVDATTVGSTGYAFLTDAQGGLVHHKGIKETAMLADMDASLSFLSFSALSCLSFVATANRYGRNADQRLPHIGRHASAGRTAHTLCGSKILSHHINVAENFASGSDLASAAHRFANFSVSHDIALIDGKVKFPGNGIHGTAAHGLCIEAVLHGGNNVFVFIRSIINKGIRHTGRRLKGIILSAAVAGHGQAHPAGA